jgi:DNA-damage-inducible protein J
MCGNFGIGGFIMAKTATSIRIDDNIKKQAMEMFEKLGIDLSAAVNMFLVQSILTGGIPFPVTLPSVPHGIICGIMKFVN